MSDNLLQSLAFFVQGLCNHLALNNGQRYLLEMFELYGHFEVHAELAQSLENLVEPIAENEGANNAFQNIRRGLPRD